MKIIKYLLFFLLIIVGLISCDFLISESKFGTPTEIDFSGIENAKAVIQAGYYPSSRQIHARSTSSSTSLAYIADDGSIHSISLVDSEGTTWEQYAFHKIDDTHLLIEIKNKHNFHKDILINTTTAESIDLSATFIQFSNDKTVTDFNVGNILIIKNLIYSKPYINEGQTVYLMDLNTGIVEPLNNGTYNPVIEFFVVLGDKIIDRHGNKDGYGKYFEIGEQQPHDIINPWFLFFRSRKILCYGIGSDVGYSGARPAIDFSNEKILRLDYFEVPYSTLHEGKLTVYATSIKSSEANETTLEFEDVALESLDITGTTLLNAYDLEHDYSLMNTTISWHDYDRRYLTWDTQTGQEYVIEFSIDPATFDYELEAYPISTDIITSNRIDPQKKYTIFFGDSYIVYQTEAGLCRVDYTTDETKILVGPEKLIEWKRYGDFIEVKLWKDSINVITKIIDIEGEVFSESSTSYGSMKIIYF